MQKLDKHAEHLRLVRYYSIQRIDLLIISLSGAGIYACFELLKYIDTDVVLTKYPEVGTPFKWAGILFTLAIISNFISQWTSYKGSSISLESTKMEIHAEENNEKPNTKLLDHKAKKLNEITDWLNLSSNFFMIAGLATLMCCVMNLF